MNNLRPYQSDLVREVKDAWKNGCRSPCIVLGCGGGKSCIVADIARKTTHNGKRVLFLVHRKELVQQIRRTFISWGVDMALCDIGMVQTYTRRITKLSQPSLIITDEDHHSLARSYRKIYEAFPKAYRLGVTATPVRLNGDGLGDVHDKLIIGVSTKWLIENHYLSPYKYYAPDIADLTGLHVRKGEYIASEIEQKMIKKAVFGDVIRFYRKLADGRKAICYCSTVNHSQKTAEAFNEAGIKAAHIDGSTAMTERSKIVEAFRKGEITVLCNVDLISEGFDVPDCECAILLRPTKSLTLFIQQSMRCMRYKKGKTAVIIDHVGNYARHGMPDDDRTWTLDKKDHTRREQQERKENVTQCPECFFTFDPAVFGRSRCPSCGYEFPNPREVQQEDGDLIEIKGFSLDYTGPESCQTYGELLKYAEHKGYKKGWAYYQAKRRGLIP